MAGDVQAMDIGEALGTNNQLLSIMLISCDYSGIHSQPSKV